VGEVPLISHVRRRTGPASGRSAHKGAQPLQQVPYSFGRPLRPSRLRANRHQSYVTSLVVTTLRAATIR